MVTHDSNSDLPLLTSYWVVLFDDWLSSFKMSTINLLCSSFDIKKLNFQFRNSRVIEHFAPYYVKLRAHCQSVFIASSGRFHSDFGCQGSKNVIC